MKKSIILIITFVAILGASIYGQDGAQTLYKDAMDNLLAIKEINGPADLSKTEIKQAVTIFKQIMNKYPQTRWAEMSENQIAWAYYKGKDYSKAMMEFRGLITNFIGSILRDDWRFMTGKIAYELGSYEEAIITFQGVIDIYSVESDANLKNKIAESYIMKAKCKLKQSNYQGAETELKNFITSNPNNPLISVALIGIATSQYTQGCNNYNSSDLDNASGHFDNAIKIYADNKMKYVLLDEAFAGSYYMKALIEEKLGRTDAAIKLYEDLVRELRLSPKAGPAKKRIDELTKK